MNWPFVSRALHREFLASAEARAKAEHDNAMTLRHELGAVESRADQERAERIAAQEAHNRARSVWESGIAVLEKALAEARAQVANLNVMEGVHERDMVRSEARYADLLERFTALRLAGAQDPPPVFPAVEREPLTESEKEINKVIREQAGDNHALAKDLRRTARELKAQGKTADEIVGVLVSVWTSEQVS